jgi:hypothetical protein|tara:strand:- start:163 stop:1107 length:945 start_codon:yes stop_codon:yes gene_type:complete
MFSIVSRWLDKNILETIHNMIVGPQYPEDDSFKSKARLHQSKYRAFILKKCFDQYGNRLKNKDAKNLLNYYEKLNCRAAKKERFQKFSKLRDADMLRSEHIPFNMIAPLRIIDKSDSIKIINKVFELNLNSITKILMEYAPKKTKKEQYLRDGTSFDAYLEGENNNGELIGVGIEIKYTERAYSIGKVEKKKICDKESIYWKTAKKSEMFIDPSIDFFLFYNEIFGSNNLRQIWRNHLLGLKMVAKGDVNEFYSITLYPAGNKHFNDAIPEYQEYLRDKKWVKGITFESFIKTLENYKELSDWKNWLQERYIFE